MDEKVENRCDIQRFEATKRSKLPSKMLTANTVIIVIHY